MHFTIRRALLAVAIVAVLLALPVWLHQKAEHELKAVMVIEGKYGVTFEVFDMAFVPRHSGGSYRMEDGTVVFPDATIWKDDNTPSRLTFLPVSWRAYCFSRLKSVSWDVDEIPDRALAELLTVSSIKAVTLHGERCEQVDIRGFRAAYPNTKFVVSNDHWLKPLGTRATSDVGNLFESDW